MSKTLTIIQKKINKDLSNVNSNFKAFDQKAFDINEDLIKLESIYLKQSEQRNEMNTDLVPTDDMMLEILEKLMSETSEQENEEYVYAEYLKTKQDLKDLLCKLASTSPIKYDITEYAILDNEIFEKTAQFFGLTNESLTKRLMDVQYVKAMDIQTLSDDEYESCKVLKVKNLEKWAKFCLSIDQMITYVKLKYPNWDTLKKLDKKKYISTLESLSSQPFMYDTKNLKYFILFLKKYGLNQGKRFKAQYLLQLGLPNVNTLKIALEITNDSNFKYFINKK